MNAITYIDPGPRLCEATVCDGRIHCSGMIPEDTSADITGQVKQVLAEIDSLLARGGSDTTRILSAVIWLADIGDFAAMNAEYEKAFGAHKPARSTIEVKRLPKDARVEIECIAVV